MTRNKASNLHEIQENGRWSGLKAQKYCVPFRIPLQSINIPSTKSTFTAMGGRTSHMVARWMSFSHVWIALGAFSTTVLSGMWDTTSVVDRLGRAAGGRMGWGVDGLGYTVQRAIKHTRHPNNMPELRRRFWAKNKWTMVATWLAAWALFNWQFRDHLGWDNPGASRSWVASRLPRLCTLQPQA